MARRSSFRAMFETTELVRSATQSARAEPMAISRSNLNSNSTAAQDYHEHLAPCTTPVANYDLGVANDDGAAGSDAYDIVEEENDTPGPFTFNGPASATAASPGARRQDATEEELAAALARITPCLESLRSADETSARDGNQPLHPFFRTTKGEFANLLNDLQGRHSLTRACVLDIAKLVNVTFPGTCLPRSDNGDAYPFRAYSGKKIVCEVPVCPEGCCAFIGARTKYELYQALDYVQYITIDAYMISSCS